MNVKRVRAGLYEVQVDGSTYEVERVEQHRDYGGGIVWQVFEQDHGYRGEYRNTEFTKRGAIASLTEEIA